MKRWGFTAFLGVAAALIALIWFFDTYEQVESEVWVGPSGAARKNPYLAAMRFMQRMGYTVSSIDRPRDLDALPRATTLILLARRAVVTPERAQSLLAWAAAGGHLIIEPEAQRSRDVMLDALAIGRAQALKVKPTPTLAVELPQSERTLQVTPTLRDTLELGRSKAEWTVADAGGIRIASLRHGSGRISVVTGFHRFANRAIGSHDNAELLWRILRFAPGDKAVLLLRPPQSVALVAWLAENALVIVASMLGLIALWLWRVMPRFGPIQPGGERERRELLEHIRACGRFRWAQGARESLLDAAREICHARIARLRPRLAFLPLDERCRELAAELALGREEIAYAFQGVPRAAREFVQMVATLASIHARLSHATPVARIRKKRR